MATSSTYIHHASLAYQGQSIFTGVDLTLTPGKWLALLGQSGVGKSSLLKLIAGLIKTDRKTQASIDITSPYSRPLSTHVAYMAQTDLLLPWLTVLDNATLALKLRYHSAAQKSDFLARAKILLSQVGLAEALTAYPHQLSGGMRQRVALVRTFLENKPLILMDEPFSALDAITRYQLQTLALTLLRDKAVLMITHDPQEALRLADDILIMQKGVPGLKHATTLTTPAPREMTEVGIAAQQANLFTALAAGNV